MNWSTDVMLLLLILRLLLQTAHWLLRDGRALVDVVALLEL